MTPKSKNNSPVPAIPESETPIDQAVPRMVSVSQAARILGVAKVTLDRWRSQKCGPAIPYTKCKKYVKYNVADLTAWLQANRVEG